MNANFKTSHVIVYLIVVQFLHLRYCNFKTSHVIVYRDKTLAKIVIGIEFQNISCYCLSLTGHKVTEEEERFQNISCYCLSPYRHKNHFEHKYFKTSHVIVYPYA